MESILQKSIKEYFLHGPRSNKKLIPLHSFISNSIKSKLNFDKGNSKKLNCHSLPENEIKVTGRYYNKNVDICIKNKENVFGAVSVKFIMSNYQQNANNYFENLIGELYNLKRQGIIQWYILVIFDDIPYYNNDNTIKKYDKFKNSDRYDMLVNDGLLDCLTIIKLSNGKSLLHPNKIKGHEFNFDQFKIITENFDFENDLSHFCSKIKHVSS